MVIVPARGSAGRGTCSPRHAHTVPHLRRQLAAVPPPAPRLGTRSGSCAGETALFFWIDSNWMFKIKSKVKRTPR